MTKRKKRRRQRRKKQQSLLGEPLKLMRLGITTTASLTAYSMTLEALSKMKK